MRVSMHKPIRVLLGALALAVAPAGAQTPEAESGQPAQPQQQTVPQEQTEPVEVTDEKLRQFVAAATDVRDIQEDYVAEAQSLQEETQQKMVESVEGAGMTIDEFQAISEQLQNNPELVERLDRIEGDDEAQ